MVTTLGPFKIEHEWAWWLVPYMYALAVFSVWTGCTPDLQKLRRVHLAAMRLYVVFPDGYRVRLRTRSVVALFRGT